MNKNGITRMADEADLWADQELQCIGEYHPDWHEVRDMRFAALVAAAEREACQKECDELAGILFCHGDKDGAEIAVSLRDAIRARGNS